MIRPQLFQTVEPNIATIVMIITYQAEDRELVTARQPCSNLNSDRF
jgi:hypothetical protein